MLGDSYWQRRCQTRADGAVVPMQLGPKIGRRSIDRAEARTVADGIVWVNRRGNMTVGMEGWLRLRRHTREGPGARAPRPTNIYPTAQRARRGPRDSSGRRPSDPSDTTLSRPS